MSGPKRVLLVDDDRTLQGLLAEQLEATKEFATTCVNDGKAALDIVQRELFDLILLDVGLPDLDGREVCREMRRQSVRTPVIMLTAADSEADTIHGLEAGANDYVSKPFKMGVLIARARAQLRQFEQSEDAVFAIGPYSFRPANKLLLDNEKVGKKVRLTEKETAILKYLLRAGQKPVPRETLLTEVWGYNAGVSTHTLETHVYRLRQKIERNPAEAKLLLTEPGGYRLSP
ncbi:response regulator transcription factor [Ferrovibrio sp. MS7]|jgi:DNA-binding response OmpR family regulator|uniref:response regulator transcription factor n=1 Tax=Ferrovibrio plantarum TaxID=3119164 RepID=UPI001B5F0BF8|nr:response regulator transcription factor [Ferrovibrio sp.]